MAPPPVIRLHPDDSVVIARATLLPGARVAGAVVAAERIPAGHKVAVRPIGQGEAVRRYGQIIGFAASPISAGQHVHVHNCEMGDFAKDYAYGVDAKPTAPANSPAGFMGIRRPDGRVATRNYIGILTSVNCSAHVAGLVADMFRRNPFTGDDPLADYPNVDGVVALTHKTGCGMSEGDGLRILRRTLGGYARHVNFSHVVVMGLGCEVNQIGGLVQEQKLAGRLKSMDIQTMGGTVILSETPETYGAEHLLTRRAVSPEVGEKLVALMRWWEDYTKREGAERNAKPSPASKTGGRATLLEKPLG